MTDDRQPIEFLSDIDLSKAYLRKARFENLAEAPENPKESQVYFNTTDKAYYYYEIIDNVGSWVKFVNMRQLNALLDTKQDVLTAGEGISIEVNQQGQTVISSVNTNIIYQKNFTASDFSQDTLNILKTEHGCGNSPTVQQIMRVRNGSYESYFANVIINPTNGTVSIQANGGFDGFVVLSTPYQNIGALEPTVNSILYGTVS